FSKRILDGKYASDIDSEDFMVVFIVNRLNGAQTVDRTSEERVDANFASAFRYRSDDMDVDIIQFTFDRTPKPGPSKTWSDEEYSPLSYYGNVEPIFTCKGTTMRFGSLELLRDESDLPFVEYILGDDWELEYWQSFIYKVGQVCGKDLHPDDFLYMLHATHNKVATTLEGEYIELTVT
ncbi:hypothetical protein FOZ63_004810, partial [Perkinsus olseni]